MQSNEESYILTLKGALYIALVENIGDQIDIDKYIHSIYERVAELVNIEETTYAV